MGNYLSPGIRRDRPLGVMPASALDYRELARRRLPRQLFDYVDGGAISEATQRANVEDLARVVLRQRVMRDVSARELSVSVLGQRLAMPVILAPVGYGGMVARRGEVQATRAADAIGVPFVESTLSVCSLEEVAGATSAPPWFQLYVMRDRDYAEALMARARAIGTPVLLLTVDLAVPGLRYRDKRNGLVENPTRRALLGRGLDIFGHPRWVSDVVLSGRPLRFGNLHAGVPGAFNRAAANKWTIEQFDPGVTWEDVAWVREHWPGPLVLKGIMDLDDARRAVAIGVDGVVVSNHGGRQLDSAPSTASVLPAIADAVGHDLEVLVDGGVRTGIDVIKMIALGAKAVFIGRPWAWALAARGEHGIRHLLKATMADIDVALALTGQTSISAIDRSILYTDPPHIAREEAASRSPNSVI